MVTLRGVRGVNPEEEKQDYGVSAKKGRVRAVSVAFAGSITDKYDVIHKTGST